MKQQICEMALSGIRDTAQVLKISPTTVTEELKSRHLEQINRRLLKQLKPTDLTNPS